MFFIFKQKTAYEMRISDWSSDVCSSDLTGRGGGVHAAAAPEQGINVSSVLHDLFERERSHTESLGDELQANIAPHLYARINAQDLKRIVSNLIENARRYGRTPADDRAHIQLSARQEGSIIAIEVQDNGTCLRQEKGSVGQRVVRTGRPRWAQYN